MYASATDDFIITQVSLSILKKRKAAKRRKM
jgi:hypothetical protein